MWKDIVIGVLVAYVVIDLLLASSVKCHHSVVAQALSNTSSQTVALIVIAGVLVGAATWYYCRSTTIEHFRHARISTFVTKNEPNDKTTPADI